MIVTSLLKMIKNENLVRPVEFESTTTGLKGRCSTVELRTHLKNRDNLHRPTLSSTLLRKFFGSRGGIRTPNQRINSALRYHCATLEHRHPTPYIIPRQPRKEKIFPPSILLFLKAL